MTSTLTCASCPATLDTTGAGDDLFTWGIHRRWVIATRTDSTRAYCPNHADIAGALRNR